MNSERNHFDGSKIKNDNLPGANSTQDGSLIEDSSQVNEFIEQFRQAANENENRQTFEQLYENKF